MTAGVRVLPATASEVEWLAARRSGIGASEIAAVAGLSRRRGPWDVWSSKVHGAEMESTDEMRWGQFIEGRIVDWWARQTDRYVGQGGLFRHDEHDWLIATPDAVVLNTEQLDEYTRKVYSDEPVAVVDAKNAGWHMAGDWDNDTAPIDYVCQITWQMLAVGVREGYLVAAIGGKPPVERHFDLDDELAAELVARASAFWQLVQTRTPPPLDGSKSAERWIAQRYPDAADEAVDLDDTDVERLREWQELAERIADLEEQQNAVEVAVKSRLGSAAVGLYKGEPFVTWKTVDRRGYDVKPTKYRKFHIPKKIKEELSPGGEH